MFGLVFGTVCLIGLVKLARGGRHGCHGYGGGGECHGRGGWGGGHPFRHHHHGWGGHGWGGPGRGWGGADESREAEQHGGHDRDHGHGGGEGGFGGPGPWIFQRAILRRLFERLDTTPGQEKVIQQAVTDLRESARGTWEKFRGSREEIAKSISGDVFDEGALGNAFGHQDEAMTTARRAMMDALAKVHEALDSKQRAQLADLLARGPRAWGGPWGGPYRA